MSSADDVRILAARRTETKNLEYKETIDWSGAMDKKLELVKDVLAIANTKDGGSILIGIRDDDYELVGMSESAWRSFDQTKVNDLVQKFSGPGMSCQVYKFEIEEKRIVCIDVPEFESEPVICEADGNSSRNGKTILARGTIYVRTPKATSEPVRSAEALRELLGRALMKKGDDLLRSIEHLIKGRPPAPSDESQKRYSEQINQAKDAFFDKLHEQFKDYGHWQIIAAPLPFERRRISEISKAGELVRQCEVSLRGWNFPSTNLKRVESFAEGKQSWTAWNRYVEGYRVYRSGLFMFESALFEDILLYKTADNLKMLTLPNVIFDVTEFFIFLKRFYEILNPDGVRVRIQLNGTEARQLISNEVQLWGKYICHEPKISWEEILKTTELRASWDEIARRFLKYLFALFNWDDPSEEMLLHWQQKLLNRQF